MYIVAVDFHIKPANLADFRREMLKNAHTSLADEVGCSRFDVAAAAEDPTHIFLYEIYDDATAFQVHLASAHFKAFNALTTDWVTDKQVRIFELLTEDAGN